MTGSENCRADHSEGGRKVADNQVGGHTYIGNFEAQGRRHRSYPKYVVKPWED